MCSALATQRFDVLQCREVGRDSKERGEDTSSPLSLAGRGGSEGLLTGQQSLRRILSPLLSEHNQVLIPKALSFLKNLPYVGNFKSAVVTLLALLNPSHRR